MLPWLRLIDMLVDVTNLAISAKRRSKDADSKDASDQDPRLLVLERERLEQERQQAERALSLELRRQAGEREIGRLRLVAALALASLIAALFFALRVGAGAVGARIVLGAGWLLLLAALALSLAAQSSVGRALARLDNLSARPDDIIAGRMAPWLIVLGLGAIGIGALLI